MCGGIGWDGCWAVDAGEEEAMRGADPTSDRGPTRPRTGDKRAGGEAGGPREEVEWAVEGATATAGVTGKAVEERGGWGVWDTGAPLEGWNTDELDEQDEF